MPDTQAFPHVPAQGGGRLGGASGINPLEGLLAKRPLLRVCALLNQESVVYHCTLPNVLLSCLEAVCRHHPNVLHAPPICTPMRSQKFRGQESFGQFQLNMSTASRQTSARKKPQVLRSRWPHSGVVGPKTPQNSEMVSGTRRLRGHLKS